jgi:hypothetical protein
MKKYIIQQYYINKSVELILKTRSYHVFKCASFDDKEQQLVSWRQQTPVRINERQEPAEPQGLIPGLSYAARSRRTRPLAAQ